jgi:hypothetical protein
LNLSYGRAYFGFARIRATVTGGLLRDNASSLIPGGHSEACACLREDVCSAQAPCRINLSMIDFTAFSDTMRYAFGIEPATAVGGNRMSTRA